MGTLKLLIADSNEDFRLALAEALQQHCHVRCCRTGRDALDLLRSDGFDLFVLDLMLPELDGITLLENAAAEGICPTVLATTPLLSDYVLDAAQRLGIGYLMRKPCDVQAVAARVEDLSHQERPALRRPDPHTYLSDLLLSFGIGASLDGYGYLQEGIPRIARDPGQSVTKELYPAIAAQCGKKGGNVERCIRSALDAAWKHRDNPAWQQYFPHCKERPTNSEFISRLAEDLRQKFPLE